MLKISLSIESQVLLKPVSVEIMLPYGIFSPETSFKTLWALHCAMGSSSLFFDKLNLASYVDKENIAIIAPSLGNGYFINSSYEKQFDFLNDELMPVLRRTLPLSVAPEDNYALGISMGAFGAVHWALSEPCTFSKVALISGIYDFSLPIDPRAKKNREQRPLVKLFGEQLAPKIMQETDGTLRKEADIRPLYSKAALAVQEMGSILDFNVYCGEEDYISYDATHHFVEQCQKNGLSSSLYINSGAHNQDFWQYAIAESMQWICSK